MTGRLAPGMVIDLSPENLSNFGQTYKQKFIRAGISIELEMGSKPRHPDRLSDAAYREFYLEFFRRHNPRVKTLKTVSRLSSFFAATSIEDANRYVQRHGFVGKTTTYAVHCAGEHPLLDMTWLDQHFPRNLENRLYYYESYWQGKLISQDEHLASSEKRGSFMEALITSRVTIGDPV